ncbi:MAG: cellulase family glycosylhydrolase, partial [Anaerolineae bacterium]|nr:cellulase family glycosylhydrolase [Anaerolineae bacterium]
LLVLVLLMVACTVPGPATLPAFPVPTLDSNDADALCRTVDAAWGHDWPGVIAALEALAAQGARCSDGQPVEGKLYAAYFNHGMSLEAAGQTSAAIIAYGAALALNPDGVEAIRALRAHDVFEPPPLPACTPDEVEAAYAALPDYVPSAMRDFVRAAGDQLTIDGEPFVVRGVNYYPARHPWQRFLTETDPATLQFELDVLREAGFNTLRVFAWYGALFDCPGTPDMIVPVAEAVARLDAVIGEAAARGLRLIVTLHDLPDLLTRPLYDNLPHVQAQTAWLVARYADEAAILAWDLRNEGDIDYLPVGDLGGDFSREAVLGWLADTAACGRAVDGNHLLTAGWNRDAEATAPFVDVVSFHHWGDADTLRDRVESLRGTVSAPLLLEEFGYSTLLVIDEMEQARLLASTAEMAEAAGMAGWLAWTAFDFPAEVACVPPGCPGQDNVNLHFGLWTADYEPRPAVEALRRLLLEDAS